MESAQSHTGSVPATPVDSEAKKNRRERESLLLAHTYVLRQIESSSKERYTQALRRALEDIEQKLAQLPE